MCDFYLFNFVLFYCAQLCVVLIVLFHFAFVNLFRFVLFLVFALLCFVLLTVLLNYIPQDQSTLSLDEGTQASRVIGD